MQGLLQNLRLSAVQVRRHGEPRPVGTGFLVSRTGIVVTCRHVVADAGVVPRTGKLAQGWIERVRGWPERRGVVDIYIPAVRERRFSREGCLMQAVLKETFPAPFGDDVALLELQPPLPEISDAEVVALGSALDQGGPFAAFGFRVRGEHDGGLPAAGFIVGFEGERPPGAQQARFHKPSLTMRSPEIAPGMSGSPVLDLRRNLVVGVVERTWESGRLGKDRDLCWAVNSVVLADDPLNLSVRDEPLPRGVAPANALDVDVAGLALKAPGRQLDAAPKRASTWVDRPALSGRLSEAWAGGDVRVIALVGFGGTGKSVLAASWIDNVQPAPDGVFWWSFKQDSSPDLFFEAAVRFLSGDRVDLEKYRGPGIQSPLVARLLEGGRYIFVLDNFESTQYQSGDFYGSLQNEDLRDFIRYFALPTHSSLCLITTRAPLVDLLEYGVQSYNVDRMELEEGRALLKSAGVNVPDPMLDDIVDDWDRHALALTLIGAQLKGKSTLLPHEIPKPTGDATARDRVEAVLRSYEQDAAGREILSEEQRQALFAIALFRKPPTIEAIRGVTGQMRQTEADVPAILAHLQARRLVEPLQDGTSYSEHPLVRDYYRDRLKGNFESLPDLHRIAGEFYLEGAKDPPASPRLSELGNWIESAYHLCQAGDYDRAYEIYYDKLEQGKLVLSWKLNAYSTIVGILESFYPDGQYLREPPLANPKWRRFVVNRLGVCRMNLGRLSEAAALYQKAVSIAREAGDMIGRLGSTENLVEVESYLGSLRTAREDAADAEAIARRLEDDEEIRDALAYRGYIADLTGNLDEATCCFREATGLTSLYGIWHADHVRRIGDLENARKMAEFLFETAESDEQLDDISMTWRLRGDIAAAAQKGGEARECFDNAVRAARAISELTVLLEALLARGRWRAATGDPQAIVDLNEALNLALAGSYKLYEADIRLGLARHSANEGNMGDGRANLKRARALADETGYYWARTEAEALAKEFGD